MPAILLSDDALHIQPLHPSSDRVARLYRDLGFGFFTDARAATSRLEATMARRILGLKEQVAPAAPASHEDMLGLTRYHFALNDLRKVSAGERFPELSIEVRGPIHFRETYDLTPELPTFFAGSPPPQALAFSRGVADLFDAAMKGGWRGEWTPGWLEQPAAEWEPVDAFPDDVVQPPGYRTSPRQGKRIVAERDAGPVFERLVRSFVPGGRRSPRRVVLTAEAIYADFEGQPYILPRGLPTRVEGRARIFGRFAGMILEPRAERCAVIDELHGDLSR